MRAQLKTVLATGIGVVLACGIGVADTATHLQSGVARIVGIDEAHIVGPAQEPTGSTRSFGKGDARGDAPVSVEVGGGAGRESAAAGASFRISSATMIANGDIVAFALTPDGGTAVYAADQQSDGRVELYATPVDGSAGPTKISSGLSYGPGDEGVRSFRITPNGESVVFIAETSTGAGLDQLYSTPIDGSASPALLNQAAQRPVTGYGVLGDSQAAFLGNAGGRVELFRATINAPGSAVQLSNAGANPAGSVVAAAFTRDGSRIVYAADQGADNVFQWHSVPATASGPGQDSQLSMAIGTVGLATISPDDATVVYTADESTAGAMDLFSTPIAGGARTRLTPAMAGGGVNAIVVGPDSVNVAYLADQETPGVTDLFGARIGEANSGARINSAALSGSQNVYTLAIGPDGSHVIYEVDDETTNPLEPKSIDLLRVPIQGGTACTLHDLPDDSQQDAGFFQGIGTPVFDSRVVYPVIGNQVNVYSTPTQCPPTPTPVLVNDPLVAGDTIFSSFVPGRGERLMAWGTGQQSAGKMRKLFVGPMLSDLPVEQANVTAISSAAGLQGFEITSDESYVIYSQDQQTNGKVELFACALDSDGDGIANPDDACDFASGQDLLFDTVLAQSGTTFVWSTATNTRFVRGPLSGLSSLTTDDSGVLASAASYTDATEPTSGGEGYFYLFARDCGDLLTYASNGPAGKEASRQALVP